MPTHPLARGFLLLMLFVGGIVAVGYGVKHDSPIAFVPGIIAVVCGVLVITDFGGRHSNR